MADGITSRREGDALVLTIDNPPLNVMTAAAWDALGAHLEQAQRSGVRGIVVTGAGDRAFCAGSNIGEMLDLDGVSGAAWSRRNYAVREQVRSFPWPVVAAVDGLVLGGGMALALACDVRVASRTAEFGLPEAAVGLVGTANSLLRLVPPGKVKELVFTGRRMSADEAWSWGLVERLVEPGHALDEALGIVEASLRMSPLAVRLYKSTIDRGASMSLESAQALELERLAECWASPERRAWVEAFTAERERRRAARAAAADV
jgi:enoyl-CoA hydratase/carnithine racemase